MIKHIKQKKWLGGALPTSVVITGMESTVLLLMYSILAALMDLNTADIFIHHSGCRGEEYKGVVILLYSNNLCD